MAASRKLSLVVGALFSITLFACSPDRVGAPPAPATPLATATPDPSLIGDVVGGLTKTLNLTLLSCNVTQTYSAKQVIGPAGGVLIVGPHSLVVPPGALASNVTISAVAPAGNRVVVDFQPEGLRFSRPTALTMSYASCGLLKGVGVKIVYVDNKESILEVLPSLQDFLRRRVSAPVQHFSHYAVAE
jgi:hypothetical protein